MTTSLHPSYELNVTIDQFADALRSKLMRASQKYGYQNDPWKDPNWKEDFYKSFHEHIEKGDPIDVAAYAMFAWYHGWSTNKETIDIEC